MTTAEDGNTTRLDVRQTIAEGGEPFGEIVAAADALPEGGTLELLAPFEPAPLYDVMRRRGFAFHSQARAGGEYLVTFLQTGITPERTLADIMARHPAVAPIMARHGFDMCCGGVKAVEVAARAHGVDLDALLAELQEAASTVG